MTVHIRAGSCSYDVIIGSQLLGSVGTLIGEMPRGERCAIISDENVASSFAMPVVQSVSAAGFEPTLISIPPGEKSKSLEQVEAICERMTAAGLNGSSFVIAVGGGVVGDLAGFVAAIYHRGIRHFQIPTTLLAQVDSSIGGKTAVNMRSGKNLIGAVHHPALVITDITTLKTLPERELCQGFAEIIKHAIIQDPSLFEALEDFSVPDLEALVRRNIEIKAKFIGIDERDKTGERALLNFGHTVGHAIEQAGDYCELLHGEAVALGIIAACDVSVRKAGLSAAAKTKVIATLKRFHLPVRLPANFSRDKIFEALPRDKKFQRGQIRFVVTPELGSARVSTEVTLDDIRSAVENL